MTEQSSEPAILYRRQGAVAWITLNRPGALNSINNAFRELLPKAIQQADGDPEVGAIVIHGAGDRAFCAGADIKEFGPIESIVGNRQQRAHGYWIQLVAGAAKPLIAAVHGFCLGGGTEIALACDIRIAAEDAQFGLPEVSLGIIPGAGGTQRLSRVVGLGHALHLILSGERIGAQEAHRIGLVTRVVPRDQLLAEADRLAILVASRAPLALALAKEAVRKGYEMEIEDGLRMEADFSALLRTTEDYLEAAAAFREKRKPVFRGR